MNLSVDPATASAARAAWASVDAARGQIWASWAAAASNVLVVGAVAFLSLHEGRLNRGRMLQSICRGLERMLDVLAAYFAGMRESKDEMDMRFVGVGQPLLTRSTDDDELQALVQDAAITVLSMQWLAKIVEAGEEPVSREAFLERSTTVQQQIPLIRRRLEKYRKLRRI